MRLICYPTGDPCPQIVPAPMERSWMTATHDKFAYRCLPLNIANAHGWLLLNTCPFVAEWRGGNDTDDLSIRSIGSAENLAVSHFGHGVLTFQVKALFRTEPGYDLMISGPLNSPKDAIQALTAVVETDWCPFTFTMNWIFTRKDTPIIFEAEEPFCMLFPVKRGLLEAIEPEIRALESCKKTLDNYTAYAQRRLEFNDNLSVVGSDAQKRKWQKFYSSGRTPEISAPSDHRTKLKLEQFRNRLSWRPSDDRKTDRG